MVARDTAGTTAAAEKRRLEREAQDEALAALHPSDFSRNEFVHARLVASVTQFKQGKMGDILIELQVPFEFRESAIPLLDASAIPVSVDIVPWNSKATHPDHG